VAAEAAIYSPAPIVSTGDLEKIFTSSVSNSKAQKPLQAAERQPSFVRSDSIEAAELSVGFGKMQESLNSFASRRPARFRASAACTHGPPGMQPRT